jgi:hypothetical protein
MSKRISVNVARTVNLGNYESLKVQAGAEVDIPDSADSNEEFVSLWTEAYDQVYYAIESELKSSKGKGK